MANAPLSFTQMAIPHWIWDDLDYPPRLIQGFYKKAELERLIQRRTSRKPLGTAPINTEIIERPYQQRAVRRVGESFERDKLRKSLLVMATGSGKTRTVIALADVLMRELGETNSVPSGSDLRWLIRLLMHSKHTYQMPRPLI